MKPAFTKMHRFTSLALLVVLAVASAEAGEWDQFRGPGGRSVAEDAAPAVDWSVEDKHNLAWQAALPGRGVSGPIVVKDRIFVTCSSGHDRSRLHVVAYDQATGERLWHRQFWATGRTVCHPTSAVAAPTPASDGERIFAFYSSNDLVCLDLDGNLEWIRGLALDHPKAGNDFGMGSSPVVAGDVVVVQSEAQGAAFAEALDRRDGRTRWLINDRPRQGNWTSPIALKLPIANRQVDAVLLQCGRGLDLHRADTGARIWAGPIQGGCSTTPSPTANGQSIFLAGGEGLTSVAWSSPTNTLRVEWMESRLKPGSPSPVVDEGKVYVINRSGVLKCGNVDDHNVVWEKRLGGTFWATPVLAGNRLYCINAEGTAFVVDAEKGEILAKNRFPGDILASPAIANNGLFVRSHEHLWKIAPTRTARR